MNPRVVATVLAVAALLLAVHTGQATPCDYVFPASADWMTLQNVLDTWNKTGDITVCLPNATYSGNCTSTGIRLITDKGGSVSIEGQGSDSTTISCAGETLGRPFTVPNGVVSSVSGVTLDGCGSSCFALELTCTVYIDDAIFQNFQNGNNYLIAYGSYSANVYISNSVVRDFTQTSVAGYYSTFAVYYCAYLELTNVVVKDLNFIATAYMFYPQRISARNVVFERVYRMNYGLIGFSNSYYENIVFRDCYALSYAIYCSQCAQYDNVTITNHQGGLTYSYQPAGGINGFYVDDATSSQFFGYYLTSVNDMVIRNVDYFTLQMYYSHVFMTNSHFSDLTYSNQYFLYGYGGAVSTNNVVFEDITNLYSSPFYPAFYWEGNYWYYSYYSYYYSSYYYYSYSSTYNYDVSMTNTTFRNFVHGGTRGMFYYGPGVAGTYQTDNLVVDNVAVPVYTFESSFETDFTGLTLANMNGGSCVEGCFLTSRKANTTVVSDLNLSGFSASGNGGVFNVEGGKVLLTRLNLTGNAASGSGGAGLFTDVTSFSCLDCIANDNAAAGSGGAFRITGADSVSIPNLVCRNNYGLDGGCVSGDYLGDVAADNLTATDNTAYGGAGGAFTSVPIRSFTSSNAIVTGNSALGEGGGLAFTGVDELSLLAAVVADNTGAWGGGIAVDGASGSVVLANLNATGNVGTAASQNDGGGFLAALNVHELSLTSATVTDNTVTGGPGGGLAVYGEGSATVSNVSFDSNSASMFGGAFAWNTGSADITTAAVTVDDCDFTLNTAGGAGGAAAFLDLVNGTVSNATFAANTAAGGNGGAMSFEPQPNGGERSHTASFVLADVTATGNSADGSGGAFYAHSSAVDVSGVFSATDNDAGGNGGGVAVTANSSLVFTATLTVTGNSAGGTGGALSVTGDSDVQLAGAASVQSNAGSVGGGLYVADSTVALTQQLYVTDNVATDGGGGGIYVSNADLDIDGTITQLTDNSASGPGGGLLCDNAAACSVVDLNARSNIGTLGGSLAATGSASLDISGRGMRVDNCIATDGGGGSIYCSSAAEDAPSACTLTDMEVSDCRVNVGDGGAVLVEGYAAAVFTSVDIVNNSVSSGDGGAVVVTGVGASADFTNATLSGNVASGNGGALLCTASASCFARNGTVFSFNEAYEGGGVAVEASASFFISGGGSGGSDALATLITDNTADAAGGGASCSGALVCSFTDSVVDRNIAQQGAGLSLSSVGSAAVVRSEVADNTAANSGGGLQVESGPLTADASVFRDNYAQAGAGVYCSNCELTVTDSSLVNNTGLVSACLACLTTGTCTVADSLIADNTGGVVVHSVLLATMDVHRTFVHRNSGGIGSYGGGTVNVSATTVASSDGVGFEFVGAPVVLTDVVVRANGGSSAISVTSSPPLQGRNVFVSGNAGRGIKCRSAELNFVDSVVCENDNTEVECGAGCDVFGLAGGCFANETLCADECEMLDVCVPTHGIFVGPYDGCHTCTGDCWAGTYDCGGSALCVDTEDSYECACPGGFVGDPYANCTDVDECANSTSLCGTIAYCVNTPGSFTCECNEGYEKPPNCQDIDECTEGSHNCAVGAICTNTVGSHTCVCGLNYYGDGVSCTPCEANTHTELIGSRNRSDCLCDPYTFNKYGEPGDACGPCPSGWHLDSGVLCLPCGPGTYSNGTNQQECTPCPPNTDTTGSLSTSVSNCTCNEGFKPHTGSADIVCERDCDLGYYRSSLEGDCIPCPPQTYADVPNLKNCKACPIHTVTPGVGSTNILNCTCKDKFFSPSGQDGTPCERWCPAGHSRPGGGLDCALCGYNEYTDAPNLGACIACPKNSRCGQNSTSIDKCVCPAGFYTLEEKVGTECLDCPVGGYCAGGIAQPTSVGGYTPVDTAPGEPYEFVECYPPSACEAGNVCAEGYTGKLCAKCEDGFYRLDNRCRPCSKHPELLFAAALICLYGFVVATVWFNLQDRAVNKFASLIIGVNSLQIAAMYGRLHLEWPDLAQKFFDALSVANLNLELMSPECAFIANDAFVLRWSLSVTLPAFLFVFYTFTYCVGLSVVTIMKYMGKKTVTNAFHLFYTCCRACFQLMTFAYLPLSATVFEFFNCTRNGNDEWVVLTAPDFPCYTKWYWELFGLAAAALLIYPIGIPVFIATLLRYKKDRLDDVDFELKFGFLVGRYLPDAYGYELAIMGRKLGVVLCMAFFTTSPYIKAGGAIVVLLGAYTAQLYYKPYRSLLYNRMEVACLICSMAVLLLSVTFQSVGVSNLAKNIAIIFVICVNLLVIVVGVSIDSYFMALERGMFESMQWTAQEEEIDSAATSPSGGVKKRAGQAIVFSAAFDASGEDDSDFVDLAYGSGEFDSHAFAGSMVYDGSMAGGGFDSYNAGAFGETELSSAGSFASSAGVGSMNFSKPGGANWQENAGGDDGEDTPVNLLSRALSSVGSTDGGGSSGGGFRGRSNSTTGLDSYNKKAKRMSYAGGDDLSGFGTVSGDLRGQAVAMSMSNVGDFSDAAAGPGGANFGAGGDVEVVEATPVNLLSHALSSVNFSQAANRRSSIASLSQARSQSEANIFAPTNGASSASFGAEPSSPASVTSPVAQSSAMTSSMASSSLGST